MVEVTDPTAPDVVLELEGDGRTGEAITFPVGLFLKPSLLRKRSLFRGLTVGELIARLFRGSLEVYLMAMPCHGSHRRDEDEKMMGRLKVGGVAAAQCRKSYLAKTSCLL